MHFKITANMVTIARILLLPLPCVLLLQGSQAGIWISFVLFVVLGMTDIVDGVMARRDGPTKFGGLIDPVADKIFVATVIFSLVGIGVVPTWFAVLIFLREFFVITLRTSMALRLQNIKTSNLAKLKTIVQMGGMGTIFLTVFGEKKLMLGFAGLVFVVLALVGLYWLCRYKIWPPHWVFPVSGAFLYWILLLIFCSEPVAISMQIVVILIFTWGSALDYAIGTYRTFLMTGIKFSDWSRLFWAFAFCLGVIPFAGVYPQIVIFILIALSMELALGGVDNLVAAEKLQINNATFLWSGTFSLLFLLAMSLLPKIYHVSYPVIFSVVLIIFSMINFIFAYKKWRHLFVQVLH